MRVEVLLYAVVAHQSFALRLGTWFQQIVSYSGILIIFMFRVMFSLPVGTVHRLGCQSD